MARVIIMKLMKQRVLKNVSGGRINNRELTTVEIVSQPKTEYVYGEKLDLSNAKARITYDSGYVEDNVPLLNWENTV